VPEARGPEQVRRWARWLFINGQRRRRNVGGDFHSLGNWRWWWGRRLNGHPSCTVPHKGSSSGGARWYLSDYLLLSCGEHYKRQQNRARRAHECHEKSLLILSFQLNQLNDW